MPRKHDAKGAKGFTLLEIIITAGIAALLAAIAAPLYLDYIRSSRTTDALNAFKALELEIMAPAQARTGLVTCDDSLVKAANLESDYLALAIVPIPIDPADLSVGATAGLRMSAQVDKHGSAGIRTATAVLEEFSNSQPGSLVPGAVVTDSNVSFVVSLSEPGVPYCDGSSPALASGSGPAAGKSSNQPPEVRGVVDLGSTPADTGIDIDPARLLSVARDPEGDTLTVSSVTVASGTITGSSNRGFRFTPATGFSGNDVVLTFNVSDGNNTVSGKALIDVQAAANSPTASLGISASQQVASTGTDGRAVISQLDTGGDMDAVTMEFSVVGRTGGSATASTGPVIFNYGNQGSNNIISAWRPSNFTLALANKNYATGIDLTDGQSHRVSLSWSASSGVLKVFDNGALVKTFQNVNKGGSIPGNGHLVIGQKMNNPATQDGWSAGEHYNGQVFAMAMANQVIADGGVAAGPLYSTVPEDQLLLDVRAQGGSLTDARGNTIKESGMRVTSMQVDTDLAVVPPSASLQVTFSGKAGDARSTVTSMVLTGFPGSFNLTDASGKSGSGTVDVTNWQSPIRTTVPAGFTRNLDIRLQVEATTDSGRKLTASDTVRLNLDPRSP